MPVSSKFRAWDKTIPRLGQQSGIFTLWQSASIRHPPHGTRNVGRIEAARAQERPQKWSPKLPR
eukprot:9889757-Alexandrium_andersonii.AAC.1